MSESLGVIATLCQFVAGFSGLCLGVSFTRQDRSRFPVLRRLDGFRPELFSLAAIGLLASGVIGLVERRVASTSQVVLQREIVGKMDSLLRTQLGKNPETADAAKLAAFDTDLAVTLALQGEGAYSERRFADALRLFLNADQVTPIATLKARIADSYYHLGDFAKTVEYERAAQQLAPEWSGPPYMLALALLQLGREDEAQLAAERSCDLGFQVACELQWR